MFHIIVHYDRKYKRIFKNSGNFSLKTIIINLPVLLSRQIPGQLFQENSRNWKTEVIDMIFRICYAYIDFERQKRVFSKQLFWITPFGVKAIRTAGSTAADGNFGCLID